MNYVRQVLRNRVFQVFIALLVLLFAYQWLSASTLTVTNESNEQLSVNVENSGQVVKKIKLGKGDSENFRLEGGAYGVVAEGGGKKSLYSVTLGRFDNQRLGVTTKDQLASAYIGKNLLFCSDGELQNTVYFTCNPSAGGGIYSRGSTGEVDEYLGSDKDNSLSLAPYKSSYIEVRSNGSKLGIRPKDASGYIGNTKIVVDGFRSAVNDDSFSVSGSGFAVLDNNAGEVLYFNSLEAQKPVRIKIPDAYFSSSLRERSIALSGKYVFVTLENVRGEGQETEGGEVRTDPAIVIMDVGSGEVIRTVDVPVSWGMTGSSNLVPNELLVRLSGDKNGTYRLGPNGKFIEYLTPGLQIDRSCSTFDGRSFFTADASRSIYELDKKSGAAFLVYHTPSDDINVIMLSCVGNNVSFVLDNADDGIINENLHFSLIGRPSKGNRLEFLVPAYVKTSKGTFRVDQELQSVVAKRLVPIGGISPADQPQATEEIRSYLRKNGIQDQLVPVKFVP